MIHNRQRAERGRRIRRQARSRNALRTLWNLTDTGVIPAVNVGAAKRYRLSVLMKWVEGRPTGVAGLKPWPKPFQNLRSSRQTELEERFPRHVVCASIGNSTAVAERHYLQVTDEHYERASLCASHDARNVAHSVTWRCGPHENSQYFAHAAHHVAEGGR